MNLTEQLDEDVAAILGLSASVFAAPAAGHKRRRLSAYWLGGLVPLASVAAFVLLVLPDVHPASGPLPTIDPRPEPSAPDFPAGASLAMSAQSPTPVRREVDIPSARTMRERPVDEPPSLEPAEVEVARVSVTNPGPDTLAEAILLAQAAIEPPTPAAANSASASASPDPKTIEVAWAELTRKVRRLEAIDAMRALRQR